MIVIQCEYYDEFFKKNRVGYYGWGTRSDCPIFVDNINYPYIEKFESVEKAIAFIEKEWVSYNNKFSHMFEKVIGNPKVVNVEIKVEVNELYEYKN